MSGYSYYEYERQSMAGDRITWAVQRLIVANTVIFMIQLLLDIPFGDTVAASRMFAPPGGNIVNWLAFQPSTFLEGAIWKPLTYMFLHGGLMHLFLNMLWLYFFGPDVERALGTRQFVRFYFLCGVLAVLATFVPYGFDRMDVSVTGASGAIMAVMIAFAMINPHRQFFLFPFPIPISARILVVIVVAMNVLTAMQGGSTSVATHFGGMLAGYAYMKLIPKLRHWQLGQWRRLLARKKEARDPVGESVDNIFRFEDHKRRP